jgi:hypothetical protein
MNCRLCGAENISPSFGGRDLCGPCDCGVPPALSQCRRELAAATTAREAAERGAVSEADFAEQFKAERDAANASARKWLRAFHSAETIIVTLREEATKADHSFAQVHQEWLDAIARANDAEAALLANQGHPKLVQAVCETAAKNLARAEQAEARAASLAEGVEGLIVALTDGDLDDCCYGGSCVAGNVTRRLIALQSSSTSTKEPA